MLVLGVAMAIYGLQTVPGRVRVGRVTSPDG